MRQWTNEEIQRYLGEEHGCYITHSTDERVRNGAASGGTTSQLAINLLEQDLVDGVLVWRMACGHPEPVAEPIIATTAEEILAARGSKYATVSYPQQALPLINAFKGRLAVVALPCDTSYLRRKMAASPALAEKIRCIITLFCGHNSEPELTKIIVRRHGMQWEDVESFSYRSGLWRGRLKFRSHEGREVDIPTRTFTHYQNLHFFSERKCLNCIDHFGFDGDICTGDIWAREAKSDAIKPTVLVAKSPRGRELLDRADQNISMTAVHPRTVINGNSRGMTYHYHISARAKAARMFGIKIKDPLNLPVTPLDRLVATVGVFNYWWSHNPSYKHLIEKLPFSVVNAYIYFFKGLQQVNLFFYRPFPPSDKVSLIGATLTGNRGAEAMLVTTIGRVREHLPNARFVVHSYFPQRDREICKDLNVEVVNAAPTALVTQYFPVAMADAALGVVGLRFPRGWMPRGPRELKESRALLDLFGVSYNDGREKFLPFNVLSNWPAMLMDVPVVKLSQGLGKFEGKLNRTVGRWMLRKCKKVFARGWESYAMAEKLRLGDKLDFSPDIAFLFKDEDSLTQENVDFEKTVIEHIERLKKAGKRVLVLSVSAVVLKKCKKAGIDYAKRMAELADIFLDKGYAVVLFPNATREGLSTLHNNDLPVIDEIARNLRDPNRDEVVLVDRDLNTASLRHVLKPCDYLVASRFHAMIAGLSLGLPTLVLGWGHKYREILAQFEIEENAFDYTELHVEQLRDRIESFIANADDIRTRIGRNIARVREASATQFTWLVDFLAPKVTVCTDDEATAAQ